jgi:hypothetical protein
LLINQYSLNAFAQLFSALNLNLNQKAVLERVKIDMEIFDLLEIPTITERDLKIGALKQGHIPFLIQATKVNGHDDKKMVCVPIFIFIPGSF